ncbi:MAG: hypothetical protein CM15mP120_23130 [Pseudomonadota bacterium]|nr:MAG: hypothetical protein CM15mP120_23130 [Pseudomonadota bacterium]
MTWDKKAILWALPQPILVASSVLLVAAMLVNEWGGGILPSMDTHCRSLCNAIAADRRTILGQKTVVAAQARRNGRRRILDGMGDLALGPHRVRSLQYSGFGKGFLALRDMSPLQIQFEPTTVLAHRGYAGIRFTSSFFTTGCTGFNMNRCSGGACTRRIII